MKSDIDLNLLKVLPLIYRHKRIKSVAKILGKSEASVSKYLARLREQLGDDLFTLDPQNGYEPTPFTIDMLPDIENGLLTLEQTLHRTEFDPSAYRKEIVIALPQLSQYYIGHELLRQVMNQFPNAPVTITSWDEETYKKILEGQVDIGIQLLSSKLPKTIYQKAIGRFGMSLIVSNDKAGISQQDALKLPFVMPQAKGWFDDVLYQDLMQELVETKLDVVAKIENITCLLNSVFELEAATILATINKPIPGFHCIPLDISIEQLPPNCVMMKVQHRHSPFHQILAKMVESLSRSYRL
ncbi:LysR family transcriptional regulator [Vibrio hippocampi]|uniref:HTH-type transcriptional regulator YidZ n=1 Tax=Vibrio hippocampi TaxID=654686 RepID=A0ABM8ZN19_9VIBR|nr:LysR family transcriptional regulator [Vibrio hippocampi]CAH0529982.1 HTH-type transcriptional regulator YidZ [Vibrio hippocampi]